MDSQKTERKRTGRPPAGRGGFAPGPGKGSVMEVENQAAQGRHQLIF